MSKTVLFVAPNIFNFCFKGHPMMSAALSAFSVEMDFEELGDTLTRIARKLAQ